jgi:hypothetical protein
VIVSTYRTYRAYCGACRLHLWITPRWRCNMIHLVCPQCAAHCEIISIASQPLAGDTQASGYTEDPMPESQRRKRQGG